MKDPVVILFYKFTKLENPEEIRDSHKAKCAELGILGRMLVATEGINATFEGEREQIQKYIDFLHSDERFSDVIIKESEGTGTAFSKLKIKVRPEIVTMQAGEFDPQTQTAKTVSADELQSWYENDEDFVVLDLRNDYEIESGKFDKTVDPGLRNFRDMKEKLPEMKKLQGKKIVTVCTGGIRCEKATCLMQQEGFDNIYQLEDGIHTYMQKYPGQHFKGTLFVFDNRMTTDVVDTPDKEIVGICKFCDAKTEDYYSDDSVRPSRKILCCADCYEEKKEHLRENTNVGQIA